MKTGFILMVVFFMFHGHLGKETEHSVSTCSDICLEGPAPEILPLRGYYPPSEAP